MQRVLVYSHEDSFLFELSENEVYSLRRYSAINGQHYLDIETSAVLEKGMRVLTSDERGRWHEHVVSKIDEDHASGEYMTGKYRCFWSLQHDLTVSRTNHILNNATAREALTAALDGTNRWTVGQVTVTSSASASMYRTTAWKALQTLVKAWGGEIEAVIGVDQTGVISRSVNFMTHIGSSEVTRRFDYGDDMTSISRQADDSPLVCRIIPLGKGEQSGDGYGRKITIESVNGGLDYLQNDSMAPLVRMPNGNGGWEYPYAYVENGDIDDPQALKDWALSILEEATSPKVTYKADVLQLSLAGMDAFGVSEGDPVYCVDRAFTPEGIRVYGRVTALDEDLLEPSNTKITIGYIGKSVVTSTATTVASLSGSLGRLQANASGAINLTDAYVQAVINRLNEEANVTGGYFYYVVGEGVRTYDVAVSDPSIGSEASKVVEIKGGTIRIANSRTSGGDWDWKTVFVSGHVAAELVTAANITAGYIGSASSGNYWDLDGGMLNLVGNMKLEMDGYHTGAKQYLELSSFREKVVDTYRTLRGIKLYTSGESVDVSMTIGCSDAWYAAGSTSSTTIPRAFIYCDGNFDLVPYRKGEYSGYFQMRNGSAELSSGTTTSKCNIQVGKNGIYLVGSIGGTLAWFLNETNASSTTKWSLNGTGIVYGGIKASTLTITGTKSRIVDTDHYADRLLYCYETSAPMFGDIGSGTIGEDGLCYVSIDDVFSETARTDMVYQVFLQKCGSGDLWVAEKTPTYFIVEGTPSLKFDWEIKARQRDYETMRMENQTLSDMMTDNATDYADSIERNYENELNSHIKDIEQLAYDNILEVGNEAD